MGLKVIQKVIQNTKPVEKNNIVYTMIIGSSGFPDRGMKANDDAPETLRITIW